VATWDEVIKNYATVRGSFELHNEYWDAMYGLWAHPINLDTKLEYHFKKESGWQYYTSGYKGKGFIREAITEIKTATSKQIGYARKRIFRDYISERANNHLDLIKEEKRAKNKKPRKEKRTFSNKFIVGFDWIGPVIQATPAGTESLRKGVAAAKLQSLELEIERLKQENLQLIAANGPLQVIPNSISTRGVSVISSLMTLQTKSPHQPAITNEGATTTNTMQTNTSQAATTLELSSYDNHATRVSDNTDATNDDPPANADATNYGSLTIDGSGNYGKSHADSEMPATTAIQLISGSESTFDGNPTVISNDSAAGDAQVEDTSDNLEMNDSTTGDDDNPISESSSANNGTEAINGALASCNSGHSNFCDTLKWYKEETQGYERVGLYLHGLCCATETCGKNIRVTGSKPVVVCTGVKAGTCNTAYCLKGFNVLMVGYYKNQKANKEGDAEAGKVAPRLSNRVICRANKAATTKSK
jgi:hypothetical protein